MSFTARYVETARAQSPHRVRHESHVSDDAVAASNAAGDSYSSHIERNILKAYNANSQTAARSQSSDEMMNDGEHLIVVEHHTVPRREEVVRVTSPTIQVARKTSIPKLTPHFVNNSASGAQKVTSSVRSPNGEGPSYIPRAVSKTSPMHGGITSSSTSNPAAYHTRPSSSGAVASPGERGFVNVTETEKVRIFVPYADSDANKLKLRVSLSDRDFDRDQSRTALPTVDN